MEVKQKFTSYIKDAMKDPWILILWGCLFFYIASHSIYFMLASTNNGEAFNSSFILEAISIFASIVVVIFIKAWTDFKCSLRQDAIPRYNIKYFLSCMLKVNNDTILFGSDSLPIRETMNILTDLSSMHLFGYDNSNEFLFRKENYYDSKLATYIMQSLDRIGIINYYDKNGKTYYTVPCLADFDSFASAFKKVASSTTLSEFSE